MMQTMPKENKRKHYLDVLRVISILAVLLMHSAGFFDDTVRNYCIQWNVSILLGSITRFAVPVFVMISGALMLSKESIDLKRLYSWNILRFFTAYLFWSLFYTFVYSFISYYGSVSIVSIKNLISGTLKGGYFHLWYMPMIIGLYVALPVLHHCVRGMRKEHVGYWIGLNFVICFVIPLLRRNGTFEHIFGETIDTLHVGFWGEYVFYFTLGYILDKYEMPETMYKTVCLAGIGCAVFTVLAVWFPSVRAGTLVDTFRMNNTPNVLLMSTALFVFVKKRISAYPKRSSNRSILFFSELSFGVYFVHEFILVEMHDLFFKESGTVSAILILFVATTAISYTMIFAIRKMAKLSRYIT